MANQNVSSLDRQAEYSLGRSDRGGHESEAGMD